MSQVLYICLQIMLACHMASQAFSTSSVVTRSHKLWVTCLQPLRGKCTVVKSMELGAELSWLESQIVIVLVYAIFVCFIFPTCKME